MSKIQHLIESINKQKEDLIVEIIHSDLSKLEKLKLLSLHKLFEVQYLEDSPFITQEAEFAKKIGCKFFDNIFTKIYKSGEDVYFWVFLTDLLRELADKESSDNLIAICSYRGQTYQLSYNEVEDIIYQFAIDNRLNGFYFEV